MPEPVDPLTPTAAATDRGEPSTRSVGAADRSSARDIAAYELGAVIGRGGRDAQRKLFLQAWHLLHLLPSS